MMKSSTLIFIALLVCFTAGGQTDENSTIDDYRQEILGEWVFENSIETKYEYLADGTLNVYHIGELKYTRQYEITTICNGEIIDPNPYKDFFLKITWEDGTVDCDLLQNVNYKGNNQMVILTFHMGKVLVFKRPLSP